MKTTMYLRFAGALLALTIGGCTAPKQSEILIKMLKAQEEYFAREIIPGFDRENHAKTSVVHYENTADLEGEMTRHAGRAAIVKIPFEKSKALIRQNFLKPLDSFLTDDEMKEFRSSYMLTSLGMYGGKQYLIPRKFETRIMVYCKSRVADAISRWRTYKDAINEDMKKINGYGLPATYVLEDDPNKWDFFDVYVVGWIWAHTPYDGKTVPRIGHRGKRYSGTSLRIIDRVFQCAGDSTQVLTMNGDAVTDAFMWEAVYAHSVYNKRMWDEAWSGTEIWKAFRDGDVFLAFMTQVDCFFIHGTGTDGLDGYLKDPGRVLGAARCKRHRPARREKVGDDRRLVVGNPGNDARSEAVVGNGQIHHRHEKPDTGLQQVRHDSCPQRHPRRYVHDVRRRMDHRHL